MIFTLVFSDEETDRVKSTVTDVRNIRYINQNEVAITEVNGYRRTIAFHENEKLEVFHRAEMQIR